jgi:hypothetical protein
VHEPGTVAAGHGFDQLGQLVRKRVVVDPWVDEDVGEVGAVGVLDEHGPVAVDLIRGLVWDLLVLDREIEQQLVLKLAIESQRVITTAAVQLEIGTKADGVQRAQQRRSRDRRRPQTGGAQRIARRKVREGHDRASYARSGMRIVPRGHRTWTPC